MSDDAERDRQDAENWRRLVALVERWGQLQVDSPTVRRYICWRPGFQRRWEADSLAAAVLAAAEHLGVPPTSVWRPGPPPGHWTLGGASDAD